MASGNLLKLFFVKTHFIWEIICICEACVCWIHESYAKEKQFDDEIDDRDKLEEDSPDYEGDNM